MKFDERKCAAARRIVLVLLANCRRQGAIVRVVRIYHAGREAGHRERDRALVRAGVEVTLIVPSQWDGPDELTDEPFEVVQAPVRRPGDVNRHRFVDPGAVAELVAHRRPDVVDVHEEPFSVVTRQLLRALPGEQAVVGYTAQNLDKRFPPPFARWERTALARLDGLYPCSRQAASVAVGKGFRGAVRVLPLGVHPTMTAGGQTLPADELRLLLVGRFVPEKGVVDAVEVLAAVRRNRPARLTLVGSGPEVDAVRTRAASLGVADAVTIAPWTDPAALSEHYRDAHVLLAPSRTTPTWVEQFGRMVVEAQACGVVVAGYASGALTEVIGTAGGLVPEGDHAALARSVLALADDPDRWRALRAAGLEAAARADWDAIATGQLELYREAVAGPTGLRRTHPSRIAAQARFGPPAGDRRAFALPVLRDDTATSRALATALDRVSRREPTARSERLRIVHLDHVARLSGGEIALERLIAAQPGHEHVVILAEDGPLVERLETAGAVVEVLPLAAGARDVDRFAAAGAGGARAGLATAAYVARLARRLRQLRPDIVHTNSLKAGFYGAPAARLAGVPVVWHVRDRLAEDYLAGRAARLTRLLLRRLPDLVLANSAETARTTGVRARVVPDPYAPTRAVSARNGGTGPLRVGMVGRIAAWKGQDVLLRALADVPDVTARIVGAPMFGEDDQLDSSRALCTDLGLDDRVEFVGFVHDVEAELAGLDVLVHASVVPEPFGQVVVEGMAAGLAVVAADAGGPREIVTDDVDGLLTTPSDPAALAAALRRLADPELRARLGNAARTRAADFAPAVVAEQMDAVWRDAIGG